MASYVLFENKITFLLLYYFIVLSLNLQICQFIMQVPVYIKRWIVSKRSVTMGM